MFGGYESTSLISLNSCNVRPKRWALCAASSVCRCVDLEVFIDLKNNVRSAEHVDVHEWNPLQAIGPECNSWIPKTVLWFLILSLFCLLSSTLQSQGPIFTLRVARTLSCQQSRLWSRLRQRSFLIPENWSRVPPSESSWWKIGARNVTKQTRSQRSSRKSQRDLQVRLPE